MSFSDPKPYAQSYLLISSFQDEAQSSKIVELTQGRNMISSSLVDGYNRNGSFKLFPNTSNPAETCGGGILIYPRELK